MPYTLNDIQNKYGESIYPLYKDEMYEPYMENDSGYGYKGVVMYDEEKDKLQCSICGEWFSSLASHLAKAHGKKAEDYKDEQGIHRNVALVTKEISRKISYTARKNLESGIIPSTWNRGTGNRGTGKRYKVKMQHKNKHGLCDAQIAARVIIVLKESGKDGIEELTSHDFTKYDAKLLQAIIRKYGGWELAANSLGFKYVGSPGGGGARYEDAELLADIRRVTRELNKEPTCAEYREMGKAGVRTMHKHFGSWRRAKVMAGVAQLLKEENYE
jgi:hypothetical protein